MLRRPSVGLVLVGLTALVLASAPASAAPTPHDVLVDLDGFGTSTSLSTTSTRVGAVVDGPTPVDAAIRTAGGGSVRSVTDGKGGRAARLPAYGSAARGILVLTAKPKTGAAHPLDPGADDFRIGARFALDATSSGSSEDNGDNLLQRGLWGDPGQYKLQVDRKRVSCRIAGTRGEVFVASPVAIQAWRWYEARCERRGDTVTLSVATSGATTVHTTRTGRIGSVSASSGVPLSVGGKATRTGQPVLGNSDQFNGRIDDVVVSITRT